MSVNFVKKLQLAIDIMPEQRQKDKIVTQKKRLPTRYGRTHQQQLISTIIYIATWRRNRSS